MHAEILLRKLVEAAGARDSGYVLALESEGLSEVPDCFETAHTHWAVVRPKSELDLRHRLWKAGSAPLVAIVDEGLARALPFDLLRRAENSRVHALEVPDVLAAILGVPVSGAEDGRTQRLALKHLEQLRASMGRRTQPTVIDRRMLDEMLLDVCVGDDIRDKTAGMLLAEWVRATPEWDDDVRALVRGNLPQMFGSEGRLLAWGLAQDRILAALLEMLIVRGLLLAIDAEELPPSVWGAELKRALGDRELGLESEYFLRRTAASLATEALDHLPPALQTKCLAAADGLARELLAPSTLAKSTVLPLGFDVHCASIVERVEKGTAVSSREIDWLRKHRAASTQAARIALLEQLARLSRWLATPEPELSRVVDFVRHYQQGDAFADCAAAEVKRALAGVGEWIRESEVVLERWRARRDAQNLAFARLLQGGYTAALHSEEVVPLHRVWSEMVLRDEGAHAGGVFVAVLDGCSYPAFVALMADLAQAELGLELLVDDVAAGVPALAPLPTITSHARGALFLGQIPADKWMAETDWRESGERKTDPARFAQNRALGDRRRRLFLKGDLADGGQALLASLADEETWVVAAVFNAIDDQIGSSNMGAMVRVSSTDIVAFVPSLKKALSEGRRVLVTADHGHTPYVSKSCRVGAGKTARWMSLAEGEAPPEGFIEIDLGDLGGPTVGRKAFAWSVGTYQGKAQVGFHGGCGLEEMVVPLAWIKQGGVAASVPVWWYGGDEAEAAPAPRRVARPERRKHTPRPGQTDMFDGVRTQQALAAVARLPFADEVLAKLDDLDKATLDLLYAMGSATATELAKAQHRKAGRVNGYMSRLGQKLNGLGVSCFERESLPTGNAQYRWTGPAKRPGDDR